MTSDGIGDQSIIDDSTNKTHQLILSPFLTSRRVLIHTNNHRSLSTSLSMDQLNVATRSSVSSTRRASTFDVDTQRIFERQQRQERLANIRTTLTLFIVTTTFILMYLPSIIITLFNIKPYEFREVLFLLYYINSAVSV